MPIFHSQPQLQPSPLQLFTPPTPSQKHSAANIPFSKHAFQEPPFLSLSGDRFSEPELYSQSSPFDSLPREILTQILQEVMLFECNGSPSSYYSTMCCFAEKLTTCSAFYDVGAPLLYRHAAFADPKSFHRFLSSIKSTNYGLLVRTLDFSGYIAVGSLARNNAALLNSEDLLQVLQLCPNLNEFLATENIEDCLDQTVIAHLLSMPYLTALDFCAVNDDCFVQGLAVASAFQTPFPQVTRLSLHGCSSLPPQVIQATLALLPNLTRLDLTNTQVTSDALLALPQTARLTHLSLSKCINLTSAGVSKFFHDRVAATQSLIWLNMMFDPTKKAPITPADLESIVSHLPPVKYLNLHGLPVRRLDSLATNNLESLSLGYADITIKDLKLYLPTLPKLLYLDLTGNPNINIWTVQDTALLNCNDSIKMFEFSADLLAKLDGIVIPGFSAAKGQGRRGWLIRGPRVPVTNTLSYATHSGPSAVSGPTIIPSISSPDHKRFTFTAYAKTRGDNHHRDRSASPSLSPQPPLSLSSGASSRSHLRSPSLRSVSPAGLAHVGAATNLSRPVTVLGMDMGSPEWTHASRKVNMCYVGIGGNMTADSCKERGIYLYYGYRK